MVILDIFKQKLNKKQSIRLKINMEIPLSLKVRKDRNLEDNRRIIRIFMTMTSFLNIARNLENLK